MKNLFILLFSFLLGCSGAEQAQQSLPDWINSPYRGLDEKQVLASVGSGATFDKAKEAAYRELGNYFAVSIRSKLTISSSYSNNSPELVKIDDRIMLSSNSKLSFVSYDVSQQINQIFYVRAVLDKAAFASYLNDQYTEGFLKISDKFDQAKDNPLHVIKFSQLWKTEYVRLKRIQDYLSVLNAGVGYSELNLLESELLGYQHDLSIIVETKFKADNHDESFAPSASLNSALKNEFKRLYPQFDFGIEKENSLYVVCMIVQESEEQKGKDWFTYVSYQYTILDRNKEVLEQVSGNAKGAGSTSEESLRQIGVKIARQISDSIVL